VAVARIDLERRELDFRMVAKKKPKAAKKKPKAAKKKAAGKKKRKR